MLKLDFSSRTPYNNTTMITVKIPHEYGILRGISYNSIQEMRYVNMSTKTIVVALGHRALGTTLPEQKLAMHLR